MAWWSYAFGLWGVWIIRFFSLWCTLQICITRVSLIKDWVQCKKPTHFSLARYIFRTLKRKSLKRKFDIIMTRVLLLQAIKGTLEAWLYLFSLTEQRQVREKSNRKSSKGSYLYIQFIFYQNTKLEPKIQVQMQKSHMRSICFQNDSVCVNNVYFRRC